MNQDLKANILRTLQKGFRYDGRKTDEYREISVETGVVKTAEGSACVKIGETHLIAGIKTEISTPYPDSPDKGTIMVGVEFTPMASPNFEPGPPSIQSIEIARVVDRGIRESKSIDFKKLCITEGEKAWIIIIDICIVNDDGNLMDAASLAAIAALKDAKFPEFDGKAINYKKLTDVPIPVEFSPIESTVLKIGDYFLVDPIPEEEAVAEAKLTVATMEDGKLCAMQKSGAGTLTIEDIKKMVELAAEKTKEIRAHLGGR